MCEQTKVCSKCGEEKALDMFGLRHNGADGRKGVCKTCHSSYVKELRIRSQKFADQSRANAKDWKQRNRDAVLLHRKVDTERRRSKIKKQRDDLDSAYVSGLVTRGYFPRANVPPNLIELKREQLKLHRAMKQLNQAITNQQEKTK